MQVNKESDSIDSNQTLAKPGAGIPYLERKVLGLAVRLISKFKSREHFEVMFRKEAEKIGVLVEENEGSKLTKRVLIDRFAGIEDSSRDWSVLMTIDHLNIVNCGLSQLIMLLTGSVEEFTECDLKEVKIEEVKPSSDVGLEVIKLFKLQSKKVADSLSEVGDLDGSHTHIHPWFGRMNAKQWFALLAIHMGLHRKQIEKILSQQ